MSKKAIQIPDLPEDLPYNLRAWCEAVESQLFVLTDAGNTRSGDRAATVDELIDAGVPNATNLKESS